MIPAISEARPPDPNRKWEPNPGGNAGVSSATSAQPSTPHETFSDADLLARVTSAETISTQYMTTALKGSWERSYKAVRNEHFAGSKYLKDEFKARSKIFRPKTRSAVRKNQAAAAEALFANVDAVTVQGQNDADPIQRANGDLINEIMNYRMQRYAENGIRWFQTSMGARHDAQVAGVCISLQTWKFIEEDGQVIEDRPSIELIAPENCLIHPAASWIDPANSSPYFIIRHPMYADDIIAMTTANPNDQTKWRSMDAAAQAKLRSLGNPPIDIQGVRRAREGGTDATDRSNTGADFAIIWVYQVFMRIKGKDYTWWSVDKRMVLSDPIPTRAAHPAFNGRRPIVVGYGSLEPHVAFPMSPVESWQQMQTELNDVANLSLDHMKQVVSPLTKVRRGRQVDLQALQRRGPNTILHMKELDDVEFDRPQDVPPSATLQQNVISSDFDDLAGAFNQGSVQTNRQLNETVGGMRLLSGAANTVTEFDLRVWCETWVEPVLRQVVLLEQMYESDEKLLAIAGEKAKLWMHYGISEITDKLLRAEVMVRVNAGTGAGTTDPAQKLTKFKTAVEILQEALGPSVAAGVIEPPRPNAKEMASEVFGAAGYKDGGERFFLDEEDPNAPPKPPPQPDPAVMEAQQKLKQAEEKHQLELKAREDDATRKMLTFMEDMKRDKALREMQDMASQHSEQTRATQRERELEATIEKANAIVREAQTRIRETEATAAAKTAAVEAEARTRIEQAKQALDVARRENEIALQKLEVERKALEVREKELAAKEKKIELDRQAAEISVKATKEQADIATQTAKAAGEHQSRIADVQHESAKSKIETDKKVGKTKEMQAKAAAEKPAASPAAAQPAAQPCGGMSLKGMTITLLKDGKGEIQGFKLN